MSEYLKSLIADGTLRIHEWFSTEDAHRNVKRRRSIRHSQHTQAVLKRRAANKRAAQQRRRNRH